MSKKQLREELIRNYQLQGKTPTQIIELIENTEYKVHYSEVYRIIKRLGFKPNETIFKSNDVEIVDYVLSNYGKIENNDICKKLNITDNTIQSILKKNNVAQKKSGTKIITDFNLDINNEIHQYWLGFLSADGSINSKSNGFSLHNNNLYVLHYYKEFITKIHKEPSIYTNNYNTKQGVKTMFNILAFGKNLVNDLSDLGIVASKTYILKLKFKFNRGFILGVIDGDGDCHHRSSNVRITTASIDFANQLKDHFDSLGIYSVIKPEGNYYRVQIQRKKEIKKLFEYLYTDWNYFCVDYKRKNMLGSFNYKQEILEGKDKAYEQYNKFVTDFYSVDTDYFKTYIKI